MPITLESLKRKVGKVTLFDEDGDENALHVEYYLVLDETLDQDVQKQKAEARKQPTVDESTDELARRCIKRIAKWDLVDGKGQPVPLEVKAVRASVPHEALVMILNAIAEDKDPNSRRRGSA